MNSMDFSLPPDTHTVILGVGDAFGLMRGKRIPASNWQTVCENGNAMSLVLFTLDMTCDVWETPYANFDNGYPDMHIFPLATPVSLPWEPGVAVALARAESLDHAPIPIDPRNALIKQVERAQAMGYDVFVGPELEFYLLDPKTGKPTDEGIQVYGLGRSARLEHIVGPIRRQINECGIPIEQSNPEYAPGQVEVNIRYSEALQAADHVVLFKSLVRQLGIAHNYLATFMPKPFYEQCGSGFHTHYSLWKNGKNVFADEGKINSNGRAFIAGLQRRMAETALIGSPTVNGFRRREPYSFCPVNTSWGYDNRTAGIRVIEGKDSSVRIEKRDAGADANPYLLLATDIAAGLDGIELGLEPTEPTIGNAYEKAIGEPIPRELSDAIRLARGSDWLKDVIGADQWELRCQISERELRFFAGQVTKVEVDRYLKTL
ncbi:MAG: glutamine synthetase family protein [Aestuariivita sp.]|nr:glutamine synthetase family protein [Aestuariivita sp.]MCY4289597.1 glutamine synthetase family protein [Aestuariivita sp.]MCY4346204.1 glutamine synthetase family protein [Aestuariivita sp.]